MVWTGLAGEVSLGQSRYREAVRGKGWLVLVWQAWSGAERSGGSSCGAARLGLERAAGEVRTGNVGYVVAVRVQAGWVFRRRSRQVEVRNGTAVQFWATEVRQAKQV